jgi:cell fate regulator YaaT (PSP1 superfamily)
MKDYKTDEKPSRQDGKPNSESCECSRYNCYGHTDSDVDNRNQTEFLIRSKSSHIEDNSEYVEIEFTGHRKELYCNTKRLTLAIGQHVIVETESGEDIGKIYTAGKVAKNKVCRCEFDEMPEFDVVRIANEEDVNYHKSNLALQPKIVKETQQLAEEFGLELKIIAAEWQFDRQRLTVSFSAPQRVDFRTLVKELARLYRTRIELRQISTREEAKRLGPIIGPCGRPTCCSTFLHNFNHITLDHAKAQQLSNNISKLSGNCVRLKCCLKYEYEMYAEAFEKYPPIGAVLDTPEGAARILKVDIFKDITTLFFEADRRYEYITFEEMAQYIKEEKVYVPKDADLEAQKLYNPLSEFPEDETDELIEDTPPERNPRPKREGREGRHNRRSENRHHNGQKENAGRGGKGRQNGNRNGNGNGENRNSGKKFEKNGNNQNSKPKSNDTREKTVILKHSGDSQAKPENGEKNNRNGFSKKPHPKNGFKKSYKKEKSKEPAKT